MASPKFGIKLQNKFYFIQSILSILIFSPLFSPAQKKAPERKGEFYFSWGYNKEWYSRSNVKVNQSALGNQYTLHQVKSHDNPAGIRAFLKSHSAFHSTVTGWVIFLIKKEDWLLRSTLTTPNTSSRMGKQ